MEKNFYNFCLNKYDLDNLKININDNYILFLVYDDEYYYYLKDNEFLSMDKNINILKVIDKFNKKYLLEIINYYPVCICNKTLVIALRTEHVGSSKLHVVKYNQIDKNYQKLIKYHRTNFATLFVSSNVKQEINMSRKYIKRYKFHENYIKKYLLTEKLRKKDEFNSLLYKLLPDKKSIIDVSCGDNSDIFKIALQKKYTTIVGNDICLNYLKTQSTNKVIFTNDDIELNRIKAKSYDVSYCKNTLHHMNNLTNINNALKFLTKISRDIIIIEIVNPQESKGLPKFLNKYLYNKFLCDVGNCFLNEEQFQTIINNVFMDYHIEYLSFNNILGKYMIAKITKEEDNYEN